MEPTQKIIRIDGNDVIAMEMDIAQDGLLFYPENPRIKSIIEAECGENPSQAEIEKKMKSLEHVKELRRSIVANGGLLEPIIVKDNVVLEGNSRLAAYRILCELNPLQWGTIRATVLPNTVTDDEVFSMLGTLHIIGKTPWNPFEQAGYLKRRVSASRRPIEAIADELGLSVSSARKYIETYNLMSDNDDMIPSKWSYYFELVKNNAIQRANESYPQYEVKDTIVEDAREIRKVGKIMSATGDTAQDAIFGYLTGELTLAEGIELVESNSKFDNILSKIKSVTEAIIKDMPTLLNNRTDTALIYQISNLQQQLKNIIGD
jgi:hypothetical protein